jgi:dGTPase
LKIDDLKLNTVDLKKIRHVLNDREASILSSYATLSSSAVRRAHEVRIEKGHRQEFSVDSDRILHSSAYARYIDKTQVFSLVDNDHITHRVLHVQIVSKIGRTIGRFLRLNEDLIEAIALGHDIGHCPFGHDGESYLSRLCIEHRIGPFQHNLQSVRFLEKIERKGIGINLTLQVLDGILCHDGEAHTDLLRNIKNKTFETFDHELSQKQTDHALDLIPMTLEGCVVRIADTISYVGRDIDDAIRLNLLKRSDIPKDITTILGNTNGTIVYTLVQDVIRNSIDQAYAAFSPDVSAALKALKEFNLTHIYLNPKLRPDSRKIARLFKLLFHQCLHDIEKPAKDSRIVREFLGNMHHNYRENTSPAEIARDYISGMTDKYFMRECNDLLFPRHLGTGL